MPATSHRRVKSKLFPPVGFDFEKVALMDPLQSNSLRCFSQGSSHQQHWARLLMILSGLQTVDWFPDWFFWTAVLPVKQLIITSCSWPWSRSLGLQGQNLTGSQPIPQTVSSCSTRFCSWTSSVDLVHVSLCMKAEKRETTDEKV